MKKKVLIFYSNTGSGHLSAAQSLKKEIENLSKDTEVILAEGLDKTNFGIKLDPSKEYALLSSTLQPLYNFFYILTDNKFGVAVLRFFIKLIWGGNFKKIIDQTKPDLIISTHHHVSPSTIAGSVSVPFVTMVTDLGNPHIIWYDKNASKIIVPTKEILDFAKKITGKPDKIVEIGYPLKSNFVPGKKTQTNNILIIGGGTGSGNIYDQVDSLLKALPDESTHNLTVGVSSLDWTSSDSGKPTTLQSEFYRDKKLTVICGINETLQDQLKKLADSNQNLEVLGFVDDMPNYYNNADLVITKAGPGTIVEAAIMKKPLIITGWVGLQEKSNIDFVIKNNLGIYEPEVKKLPQAIENVYKNPSKYAGRNVFNKGAKEISEYINREYLS